MRAVLPATVVVFAIAILTGCSSGGLPGNAPAAGAPASTGTSSTAPKTNPGGGSFCSTAHDALAKVVTGALSAPYQRADTCNFGVGPNGGLSGVALGALYGDGVVVKFDSPDTGSNYQAALDAYAGSKSLSGVGTAAKYYDGGNGDPQVFAKSATAFCLVQTSFNDATEVGLSKPGGSRTIAAADAPGLAAKLGAICSALFG
ncbi:MAG TPA: hypothetical protein VHZ81_11125 [Galbitalea sp.]|jgi:hypothetical protein|nr:hypothetical protein [Galbitalea sp.]